MKKYFLPFLLSILFFFINLFTLSDYGINFDAAGHMLRGQAFAQYIVTGKRSFDLPKRLSPILINPNQFASRYYFSAIEVFNQYVTLPPRPLLQQEFAAQQKQSNRRFSFYQHESWNPEFFLKLADGGHFPFVAILAAFSNRLWYQVLGVLGDIESYQLIYLLFSSFGIFIVSLFTFEITTSFTAAFVAGLSLALFPIFIGEAHTNMKDPIQAAFFAGSIWGFWHWIKAKQKLVWFIIFTLFVAASLGVKWNIVFLPFILLPWLFSIRKTKEFKKWFKLNLLFYSIMFLVLSSAFLILIWPYAWTQPLNSLISVVNYYYHVGIGPNPLQPPGFILPGGINSYPLLLLLAQTPTIILILLTIAIYGIIRKKFLEQLNAGYLLLLWLIVPLIRQSLPGVWFYGGLRQIMEVLPTMAVLAGVGAYYLVQSAKCKVQSANSKLKIKKTFNFKLRLLTFNFALLIILCIPIVRLHPNENTYFNMFAGGLRGAVSKNLVDYTVTSGNIYKQAALWLNKNAEKDANLAHLDGSMFALSPLWLRSDISYSPYHFSGFDKKGEYLIQLYNPLDPPVFASRYPNRFLKPVKTIDVDGVPLAFIYKNDPTQHLLSAKSQERFLEPKGIQTIQADGNSRWQISLGQRVPVTRIIFKNISSECIVQQNELIGFFETEPDPESLKLADFYRLNEKVIKQNEVDYLFAQEAASFIYIIPLGQPACIGKNTISSIGYLR